MLLAPVDIAMGIVINAHYVALRIAHIPGSYPVIGFIDALVGGVVGIGNVTRSLVNFIRLVINRPVDIGDAGVNICYQITNGVILVIGGTGLVV